MLYYNCSLAASYELSMEDAQYVIVIVSVFSNWRNIFEINNDLNQRDVIQMCNIYNSAMPIFLEKIASTFPSS